MSKAKIEKYFKVKKTTDIQKRIDNVARCILTYYFKTDQEVIPVKDFIEIVKGFLEYTKENEEYFKKSKYYGLLKELNYDNIISFDIRKVILSIRSVTERNQFTTTILKSDNSKLVDVQPNEFKIESLA